MPAATALTRPLGGLGKLGGRVAAVLAGGAEEAVADGVWRVRGGLPVRTHNVYLVRDGDGVLAFDAGSSQMAPAIASAAARLGGLTRVVLGHGHADHRGAAPALGVPVQCAQAAVVEVAGAGGRDYQRFDELAAPGRWTMHHLLAFWDGGPVDVASTLREDDEVAGFRVIDVSGHARGQIALFRESDRVALTTDAFYTLDIGRGHKLDDPILPVRSANWDDQQARDSLRRLAALEPSLALPGHADAVTGDVRARLERAAA